MSATKREALAELSRQLGAPEPAGIDRLTAAQVADLAAAISDARRAEREALAAATDAAVGHLPRLLRGPVRRIVGG